MTLDAHDVRGLAAGPASPRARDLAAEKTTDWISPRLDPRLAAVLARALEVAIDLEDDETVLESQLNALSELSSFGLVPADVIARVLAAQEWGQPWAADFVTGLRDDLAVAQ